ncbi:MAG: class I fructose-bisphosphate aldolase [Pseudomonadota bacterium]|nr:class I fructose-bisphosphate aldolase [Pseudomonadota bacterium]
MNDKKLNEIAKDLSAQPKGILAADESTNTITKRFDVIDLESNFENRRKYRELLFKTKGLNQFISGIILFDETIKQSTSEGIPFAEYLNSIGIFPGIKVDTGALPLTINSSEKFTEGLDGLSKRLDEYKKLGAVFTKWRAIININEELKTPTEYLIELNTYTLARYAKIVQESGLVPIVEPEVLMDGKHSIEKCFEVTSKTLKYLFEKLSCHSVMLDGILLKPNMVISGNKSKTQASISEVASMTVKCMKENVPNKVPGIVFLSGGQSNELATEHLNEMNKSFKNLPWNLSFSYGRALQQPTLLSWKGKENKVIDSQNALIKRSKLNSIATLGDYSNELENHST